MKLKGECQYLVDRYVDEVSLRLPRRGRTDIAAEIRSLILAALEDRAEQAGQPPDESLTLEVLKALGPPQHMAASYQPAQYLIGPKTYPSFLMTLQVVLVYWMLVGPPVLGLNPEYLALNQTGPRIIAFAEETLLPVLAIILEVAFVVHLVLKAIALVYKFFQLLKAPSLPVWTFKRN